MQRMIDLHDGELDGELLQKLNNRNQTFRDVRFIDCRFEDCDFTETSFLGCRFIDCVFSKCDFSMAQLTGSSFRDTLFEDSRLDGIDWTRIARAQTSFAAPISFKRCSLSHSTFIGLELPELNLIECRCMNSDFRQASLPRGKFTGTDFSESMFHGTNLTQADFKGARNYRIDPSTNTITKAKFQLPEAMELLYAMDIELID